MAEECQIGDVWGDVQLVFELELKGGNKKDHKESRNCPLALNYLGLMERGTEENQDGMRAPYLAILIVLR